MDRLPPAVAKTLGYTVLGLMIFFAIAIGIEAWDSQQQRQRADALAERVLLLETRMANQEHVDKLQWEYSTRLSNDVTKVVDTLTK